MISAWPTLEEKVTASCESKDRRILECLSGFGDTKISESGAIYVVEVQCPVDVPDFQDALFELGKESAEKIVRSKSESLGTIICLMAPILSNPVRMTIDIPYQGNTVPPEKRSSGTVEVEFQTAVPLPIPYFIPGPPDEPCAPQEVVEFELTDALVKEGPDNELEAVVNCTHRG